MRFTYWGTEFDGFDHPYNDTIRNERAVEIAIALDWLPGKGRGLEVGNVLAHYDVQGHRVVDRYEVADGIENLSVFDITGTYDWVVPISTLEHVGFDEPESERDPDGSALALTHLQGLLAPAGRMLITAPMGYHHQFDETLLAGAGADRSCSLVRAGDSWVQTATVTPKPYGSSTIWAESVWIGEYEGGRP